MYHEEVELVAEHMERGVVDDVGFDVFEFWDVPVAETIMVGLLLDVDSISRLL